MWVLNPFLDGGTDHSDALFYSSLSLIKEDYFKKAAFKTYGHPMDFWISLLGNPEYKDLADQVTDTLSRCQHHIYVNEASQA